MKYLFLLTALLIVELGSSQDIEPKASDKRSIYSDVTTSINKVWINSQMINVFPNPAQSYIQIEINYDADFSDGTLEIFNNGGQRQNIISLSKYEKSFRIDISDLPSGIYFCKLVLKNGYNGTKKFIVQ